VRDNPKQWVEDYNRKVLNLPTMGGSTPKRPERGTQNGFNICRMPDLFILIRGERSMMHEASDPDPQDPIKQEITRLIVFFVPAPQTYF